MKPNSIYFFDNGMAAVFVNGQQAPELQATGWAAVFAKHIESLGADPASFVVNMPGGGRASFKRWDDGEWHADFPLVSAT
jgi:hypothetical protein